MAHIIHRGHPQSPAVRGFSLIEVMVAVVILATGLLALTALQGTLARNSADAKARSAVMAAMTSRMAEIRRAPPATGKTWTTASTWVNQAAVQAGTSDLKIVETVQAWGWKPASTTFESGYVSKTSNFTRAKLAATWTAADGSKSLALSSDFSGNIYGLGKGYPGVDPLGSAARYPKVRQDNPSNTAGVIPIVTGDQATAASNPQPIIVGSSNNLRVGTSFDLLNYVPEGATALVTKRFQTEVIKCRCSFGAAGYSVAGKAQWPTTWDGTTYSVYAGSGNPAGVAANAGENTSYSGGKTGKGRLQSEQCTECCRDHHDAADTAGNLEARYDPESTSGNVGKFNEANGILTPVTTGNYAASCRVVKVDGLWRTTADMYQRHYGLLETTTVSSVQAKSGIPSANATAAYQTYVKDYLSQYTSSSTTAPAGAVAMFDEIPRLLNLPVTVNIAAASTSDYRYLHGRGLYVDYLGTKARAAIGTCTGKSGSDYTECVLPALPFTTINLTEMARWTATDATILNINTNKSLNFNVTQPSGGRTAGIKLGTASNDSVMRKSNSGVAVSDDILGGVDTNGDEVTITDSQRFVVGAGTGSGGGTGDTFLASLTGGGSNPFLTYAIGITDVGNCTHNGTQFSCPTNSVLPDAGTVTLTNYNQETTADYDLNLITQCTYVGNGNFSTPGKLTVQRPVFTNFGVNAVTNGGIATWLVNANNGKTTEVTTIVLSAIPKSPAAIQIILTADSTQQVATLASTAACTYDKSGGGAVLKSITWTKAWQ